LDIVKRQRDLNHPKKMKSREGFTLVELLVVIVILGVLAGIGVQQFGAVRNRANETAHSANQRVLRGAAQMLIMMEEDDAVGTYEQDDQGDLGAYVDSWPNIPGKDDEYYVVEISIDENDNFVIEVNGEL